MRKRIVVWFAVLLAVAFTLTPLAAAKSPGGAATPISLPAPSDAAGSGDVAILGSSGPAGGSPGTWYVGATPPNVDYTKPVLLFVHGKGGWAGVWWEPTVYHGTNDMYAYAYNNGYRTAFVDLYWDRSMWDNGQMLNNLLPSITSYFGVSKVTIVAHSKGGVDSNAASVHYGANPRISRVITLGTPHWGTPIADMAYSTWTWWLAELLGERNDATYVMQTGYMSYFRGITDGRDSTVPYYTLSGYKCGPFLSALWWGCATISGEDDGLVPVASARKPGATHLKEGYWDHDEIRMGSRTWSWFAPVIRTAATGTAVAAEGPLLAAAPGRMPDTGFGAAPPSAPGNLIMRGGKTPEPQAHSFPVESGVRSAAFTFLATSADFKATLTAPDGKAYPVTMAGQVPAGETFAGAWMGTVEVTVPAAGSWSLQADSGRPAGWFMTAALDSDLVAALEAGTALATPGGRQELTVGFGHGRSPASAAAEAAVSLSGQQPHAMAAMPAAGGKLSARIQLPGQSGIHNVTITVTGTLDDGSAFERTLVSSFAAVAAADRGTWR